MTISTKHSVRALLSLCILLPLAACDNDEQAQQDQEQVIRGLRTVLVKDEERTTERKYPGVLQPSSISTLAFEVAGRLGEVKLDVGQRVTKDEVLANIDPKTLELAVQSAEAAVTQANSNVRTTSDDYKRKAALLKKGVVTKAAAEQSLNASETAKAGLVQARKQLETAKENLGKAELKAPFEGIINTVEIKSFGNVSPGSPAVTIYSAESFEASFSVSYDVINLMAVGKKATIRLADNPAIKLDAIVSEIGAKADTVSSFPVVVTLKESNSVLKAGMAIEISIKFEVEKGKGYLLPLSVLSQEGRLAPQSNVQPVAKAFVYVFDEADSTVKRREVLIAGVRENSLIVIDGIKKGDRVASAGVSFLRDGQKVKLLKTDN